MMAAEIPYVYPLSSPDIGHQATAKVAPEQCDQHADLQVVRMITVQGKHAHTDGTLQGVRTFDEDTFSGGGNRMDSVFSDLRKSVPKASQPNKDSILWMQSPVTYREIDAAIIGMIVTVINSRSTAGVMRR